MNKPIQNVMDFIATRSNAAVISAIGVSFFAMSVTAAAQVENTFDYASPAQAISTNDNECILIAKTVDTEADNRLYLRDLYDTNEDFFKGVSFRQMKEDIAKINHSLEACGLAPVKPKIYPEDECLSVFASNKKADNNIKVFFDLSFENGETEASFTVSHPKGNFAYDSLTLEEALDKLASKLTS